MTFRAFIALSLTAALTTTLPAGAQQATAQPATAQPATVQPATAQAAEHPATILISIDGMRPDYLDRGLTPNLNALKAKGVAAAMRPSFPTKTFPNHYTIVTGMRPDRSGIVGNSMMDPRRPGQIFSMGDARQALDPFWWSEAEPVWITAEKAGIRAATMFWPGSEVASVDPATGLKLRPRDWMRFDQNIGNAQRVNTVLDWMRRPAEIRPQLITMYFDTVDTIGHRFGPGRSPELDAAITEVDARIGDLVAGIAAMGREANIVITADHGMAQMAEDRVIQLDDLIDQASYIAVEMGPYGAIEPVTGTDTRVHDALLKPHDHMQCYRKEDLPARLHYGKNPRVAAIICLAAPGWTILSGPPRNPVTGGAHGYDNADPDMLALFMAFGPSITPTPSLPVFDNVDVYPLIARLAGFDPLPTDGTVATLSGIVTR
ncbi:alkaline phosphatase family protein [Blastomonas aquatica]|nr:ectonucleotide pyrophosphatase/phosphodiesterase [Blastomonas aquatica]